MTKTTLLALECVRERFQGPIVGPAQNVTAASVVKQRVNGFLQHALLVAHDHVGRAQIHQLLEAVVAVDDATIQIV